MNSITCIQRSPKGSHKSGLLQQVVFKCRLDWAANAFNLVSEPFPKQQILDSSKLKELADDNFKFDKSGRKLMKCVENTVGKGEIAHYEQFRLFPQCFQNTCTTDM